MSFSWADKNNEGGKLWVRGGPKGQQKQAYEVKSGAEVPMSKALNPDYSSGAAQWPTAQSVVALDSLQLEICNYVNVIASLKKNAPIALTEGIMGIDRGSLTKNGFINKHMKEGMKDLNMQVRHQLHLLGKEWRIFIPARFAI